jgi:hypothetical protein
MQYLQSFVQRLGICLHACCGNDDAWGSAIAVESHLHVTHGKHGMLGPKCG